MYFFSFFCICWLSSDIFELQVPHVNRTDYQLIDISEDGFVCLFVQTVCVAIIHII